MGNEGPIGYEGSKPVTPGSRMHIPACTFPHVYSCMYIACMPTILCTKLQQTPDLNATAMGCRDLYSGPGSLARKDGITKKTKIMTIDTLQ